MEITPEILENFNNENKTKHTVESWEKSNKLINKLFKID